MIVLMLLLLMILLYNVVEIVIDAAMKSDFNKDLRKTWCQGHFNIYDTWQADKGKESLVLYYKKTDDSDEVLLKACKKYKEEGKLIYIIAEDGYCILDQELLSYSLYESEEDMVNNGYLTMMNEEGFEDFEDIPISVAAFGLFLNPMAALIKLFSFAR